jgi:membrane protein involved in colicin uptake
MSSHSALLRYLQAHPGAAGYIADADRFHTDVVGEETQRRRAQYERRLQVTDTLRQQKLSREETRWSEMESTQQKEQERWEAMRDEGLKAKKNSVSIWTLAAAAAACVSTLLEARRSGLLQVVAICRNINAVYDSLPALA